jgi:hypothetical protein
MWVVRFVSYLTKGQNICNVKLTPPTNKLGRSIAKYDIPSMDFFPSGMVFPSSFQDNSSQFYNKKENSIEVRAIKNKGQFSAFLYYSGKKLKDKI